MASKYVPIFFDWTEVTVDLSQEQKGELIDAVVYWAINSEDTGIVDTFTKAQYDVYEQIKEDYLLFTNFPNGRATGRFSGNWKGGVTLAKQKERHSVQAVQWRKEVFTRDNFTCQICGKVGGNLNAHHIKKWADYPELRYEVSNGITLCERCHRDVHRKKVER